MAKNDPHSYTDTIETSKARRLNRRHRVKRHNTKQARYGTDKASREHEERERAILAKLFLDINNS